MCMGKVRVAGLGLAWLAFKVRWGVHVETGCKVQAARSWLFQQMLQDSTHRRPDESSLRLPLLAFEPKSRRNCVLAAYRDCGCKHAHRGHRGAPTGGRQEDQEYEDGISI